MADAASIDFPAFVQQTKALKAQVEATLSGLGLLRKFPLPPQDLGAIDSLIDRYQTWSDAIATAFDGIHRLQSLGYPTLPTLSVPSDTIARLKQDLREAEEAEALFVSQPAAAKIVAAFQQPESKP